jgi:sugar lactone lactonase YvrE
MFLRQVFTVDLGGHVEKVVDVPRRPSGLGFLPDGTTLVVSMEDQALFRLEGTRLERHATLAPFMTGYANDMLVDKYGRAFVGNFGFDLFGGADFRPADVVMVTPAGKVLSVAKELAFPNGMVVLADQGQLVVAETFGNRLTAFDIASDGRLSGSRIYADLGTHSPDGICLDKEGGIWVSCTEHDVFLRVVAGGRITDRVSVSGRRAVACQLGGADGRTLFCLTCESTWEEVFAGKGRARVEVARVGIPGAGSP